MPSTIEQIVPARGFWAGVIGAGQVLTIVDVEGEQGVDFLCYAAADTLERYNAPNTIKKAATLNITRGHQLLSDLARPLMTIIADSYGVHDSIGGCCSEPSNRALYGVAGQPGCRENLLAALAPFGMGRRDIVPNVNFFSHVPVLEGNRLLERTFAAGASRAGDAVSLRADVDVIAAVSNCPQINNPAAGGRPSPIRLVVSDG